MLGILEPRAMMTVGETLILPDPEEFRISNKIKINIVTVKSGWILQKIAERIVNNAPADVDMEIVHSPRIGENNFYIDVTNCYWGPTGGIDVGLFTHVHENSNESIKDYWFTLDHIIHMSMRSRLIFEDDKRNYNSKVVHSCKMPGQIPVNYDYKKPTVGIFQRGKHEGKGFNMMRRVADHPIVKNFRWIFVGNDWEPIVKILERKTDVLEYSDGNLSWPKGYRNIYDITDFVLVPSKWEGGPMGLIEAAALGKTIIAAKVGWAGREIPVQYSFTSGDELELTEILSNIVTTRVAARNIVEKLTYRDYAEYVINIFRRLK